MKLSDYIEGLKDILENEGDLYVIYSIDEEGNDYLPVLFTPSVGNYDKDCREFNSGAENLAELREEYDEDFPINAVCIN